MRRGPDPVHLPAPGRGPAAHRGAGRAQGHRDRLRDGAAALGVAAAALPDVRGRRLPRTAGRRARADEGPGRPRRAARRRRRCRQRQGRGHRRRRGRPERREHRDGHGRRRHPARHRPRQAAACRSGATTTGCTGWPPRSWRSSKQVMEADLVIGAVLIPGAKAPKLVSNDLVARMKPGSVLVDIAVDQGGCFEDTRPTTHADPTYEVHDSTFYCVANMPGAVPQHLDLRADQRDPALHGRARRQGLGAGAARGPLAGAGPEHPRRRSSPTRRSPRHTACEHVALEEVAGLTGLPRVSRVCPEPAHPAPARAADLPRPSGGRARARRQHPEVLPPGPAPLPRLPGSVSASRTSPRSTRRP